MLGTQRLLGASAAHVLRQSSTVKRAQWRHFNRQCQRQFSLHSRQPRLHFRIAQQQRHQSTAEQAKDTAKSAAVGTVNTGSRLIAYIYGTGLVVLLGFGYLYVTDTRASLHQYLVVPLLRLVHSDAEEAHHAGVRYIKGLYDFNLHIRERGNQDQELGDLRVEVFGHVLDNPIGTSAGMDKDAEIPSALLALGPAVVEVGGATPQPQEGNPKPRVFRVPSQNALINRYGLNSQGAEHVAMQLRERVRHFAYSNGLGMEPESERMVLDGEAGVPPGSLVPGKLLAVQVAKNKWTSDSDIEAVARDYVFCVEHLAKYADIMVVNVSSPNTPGLRDLQATGPLTAILSAVVDTAKSVDRKTKPAVMVKVSPDEDTDAQIEGICAAVWASGVDGVIVGNTTKRRPAPLPQGYVMPANEAKTLSENGGYSGPQMFERTLGLVKRYRTRLDQGPQEDGKNSQSQVQSPSERVSTPTSDLEPDAVSESISRDQRRSKPDTKQAEQESKQPLIKLPERHSPSDAASDAEGKAKPNPRQSDSSPESKPPVTEGKASSPREAAEGALTKVLDVADKGKEAAKSAVSKSKLSSQSKAEDSSQPSPAPPASKVIFATGGITNGEQCLEILNAGASVCQVYTAMMYSGVGTITRMKSEMREAIKKSTGPKEG